MEIVGLGTQFPGLAPFFSAWVDIQDLIWELRGRDVHLPKSAIPSLSGMLDVLGVTNFKKASRRRKKHNASNDAVRSLAVLARLVAYSNNGSDLAIYFMKYYKVNRDYPLEG